MSFPKPPVKMVLCFERQGFFCSPRQLEFCRLMLKHCSASKAAHMAGFPDPDVAGPELYDMFKEPMDEWRKEINFDIELVLNTYRRQAQAENKILVNSDLIQLNPETPPKYEYVPNDNVNGKGCKGLRDVLGLDAATKHEHSGPGAGPIVITTPEETLRRFAFMLRNKEEENKKR